MDPFIVRGIVSNLFFALILLACLFLPAGTWNYWQGWVFLAVFELCSQAFGIYFLIDGRKAIERRVRVGPMAEREPAQKIISASIIASFIAAFIGCRGAFLAAIEKRTAFVGQATNVGSRLPAGGRPAISGPTRSARRPACPKDCAPSSIR